MIEFNTSYSYDKVSFKIGLDAIIIKKIPFAISKRDMFVCIFDNNDKEIIRYNFNYSKGNRIPTTGINDGIYYLNLYFECINKSEFQYLGYFQPRSISILVKDKRCHFILSPIINENRLILSKIKTNEKALSYYLQPSILSQSDNELIIELSKKITKFRVNPMQKVLAIHDWVAENIYYDYDALSDESCNYLDYSAVDVLKSKKCVCRGYANLAVALIRAAGIPAIGQNCYALNISNDGGWDKVENRSAKANHIITFAYVENRWIYIDATWDSGNIYKNGTYIKNEEVISRRYFDTTLEMISNTHRFI